MCGRRESAMQLNTSTNYALNIMLYLAKNKRIVSSTELSQHTAISKRYLMQIVAKLRDGELLGTSIGSVGGYYLLREPQNISLYDIIILMEGEIRIHRSSEAEAAQYTLYLAFTDLRHRIYHYLSSLTLDILVNNSWDQCLAILTETLEPYYKSLHDGTARDE